MCICAYHLSEFLLSFSKKSIIKIDISIVCVCELWVFVFVGIMFGVWYSQTAEKTEFYS